tara:strand:+ start:6517 stop:7074 length:558 start_codon:yes stop_codon:yes gene_type:complete
MAKTIVNVVSAFAVILLLLVLGTFFYIYSFYNMPKVEKPYDCVVVFGAAVRPGGVPSDALSDRVHQGIDLQKGCIIFSGADSVYGRHEVDVMLDIAYERLVDYQDIEVDYQGINTKQTIQNLSDNRRYLLVSNDFHLARINLLANQSGLSNYQVAGSTYLNGRYAKEFLFVMREVVAFWYYVIAG